MEWFGSWSWFAAVVGGAALLGLGLAVSSFLWSTRNRSNDARAERGTRRIYKQANAQEAPTAEDRALAERQDERQNTP